MKIYLASRRFSITKETYFDVPEGTVFVYNDKYKKEMDSTRYPVIIGLSGRNFDEIKSAGNGNLLEVDIRDEKIEEILELDNKKKRIEKAIKKKLENLLNNAHKKFVL